MFAENNPGARQKVDGFFSTCHVDPGAFKQEGNPPVIVSDGVVPQILPKGPKGPFGPKGSVGRQGIRGDQGVTGPKGLPGRDGTGINCRTDTDAGSQGVRYDVIMYGDGPNVNQLCIPGTFFRSFREAVGEDPAINRIVLGLDEFGGFDALGEDSLSIGKNSLGYKTIPRQAELGRETASIGAHAGSFYGQRDYSIAIGAYAAAGAFQFSGTPTNIYGQNARALAIGAGAAAGTKEFEGIDGYNSFRSNGGSGQIEGGVAIGFKAALQGQAMPEGHAGTYHLPIVPAVSLGASAGGGDVQGTSTFWFGQYPGSVAIGCDSGSSGINTAAVAIGSALASTASADKHIHPFSVLIGHEANNTGTPHVSPTDWMPISAPVAIGKSSRSWIGGVAIGTSSKTEASVGVTASSRLDSGPVAIGSNARARAKMVFPPAPQNQWQNNNQAGPISGVAIGANTIAEQGGSTVIGSNSQATWTNSSQSSSLSSGATIIGEALSKADEVAETGLFFTSIGSTTGGVAQETGNWAIAIGSSSARNQLSTGAISIGQQKGGATVAHQQGISIGMNAGGSDKTGAISIGTRAKSDGQDSICIGTDATALGEGSIVLNASGAPLEATAANTVYIDPLRYDGTITSCSRTSTTDTFGEISFLHLVQDTQEVLSQQWTTISVGEYISNDLTISDGSDFLGPTTMTQEVLIHGEMSKMRLEPGSSITIGCMSSMGATTITSDLICAISITAGQCDTRTITMGRLTCTNATITHWQAENITAGDGYFYGVAEIHAGMSITKGNLRLGTSSTLHSNGQTSALLTLTGGGALQASLVRVQDDVTVANTLSITPGAQCSSATIKGDLVIEGDSNIHGIIWTPAQINTDFRQSSAYTNAIGTVGSPFAVLPRTLNVYGACTISGGFNTYVTASAGYTLSNGLPNYSGGLVMWGEVPNLQATIGIPTRGPGTYTPASDGHIIEFSSVTVGRTISAAKGTFGSISAHSGIHTHGQGSFQVLNCLSAYSLSADSLTITNGLKVTAPQSPGFIVGDSGAGIFSTMGGTITVGLGSGKTIISTSTFKCGGLMYSAGTGSTSVGDLGVPQTVTVGTSSTMSEIKLSPYNQVGGTQTGTLTVQSLITSTLSTAEIVCTTFSVGTIGGGDISITVGTLTMSGSSMGEVVKLQVEHDLTFNGDLEVSLGSASICSGSASGGQEWNLPGVTMSIGSNLFLQATLSSGDPGLTYRFSRIPAGAGDPDGTGYISTIWPQTMTTGTSKRATVPIQRYWPPGYTDFVMNGPSSFSQSTDLPFIFTSSDGLWKGRPTLQDLSDNNVDFTLTSSKELVIDLQKLFWEGGSLKWDSYPKNAPLEPQPWQEDPYTISSFGRIPVNELGGSSISPGESLFSFSKFSIDEQEFGNSYGGPKGLRTMALAFRDMTGGSLRSVNTWDVSNVKDFDSCFRVSGSTSPPPLTSSLVEWDVGSAVTMIQAFEGCEIKSEPSTWNWQPGARLTGTAGCDCCSMFNRSGMSHGAGTVGGDWRGWDVGSVKNFVGAFVGASGLSGADFSNWKPGLRVSTLTGCECESMFEGTTITNGKFNSWDCRNCSNVQSIFEDAVLTNGQFNNWKIGGAGFYNDDVDAQRIFERADADNCKWNTWSFGTTVDLTKAFHEAKLASGQFHNWSIADTVSGGNDCTAMFSMSSAVNAEFLDWNCIGVELGTRMFAGANVTSSNFKNWTLGAGAAVGDYGRMFTRSNATNATISSWDATLVHNFSNAFQGATLSNALLEDWTVGSTSSVGGAQITQMFADCQADGANFMKWNAAGVVTAIDAFANANLTDAHLEEWSLGTGTARSDPFSPVALPCDALSMFSNVTGTRAQWKNWIADS